jgi:phosphoglycerate kinase
MKKTLESLAGQPLEGQRAFVRVDFNVPLREGTVVDDTRIRASLPTIQWLRQKGSRVVLASHLGRPKDQPDPALSLRPVAAALETHLGMPVAFIAEPTSEEAQRATRQMKRGEVALLENVRFWPGEKKNDPAFAEKLARLGDFFVNDAFGSAHRAHASTTAIAALLKPAVAGFLMAKELDYLGTALADPARPFLAILGGAKVSGKIDVIEALLPKVDEILIGGAMACTFLLARGNEVGNSLVEPDKVELAADLLKRAGDKIVLPTGAVIAPALEANATTREVPYDDIPVGWAMYDIDGCTRSRFAERIARARTVFWNGPMGVFETPPFDEGSLAVAKAMAATRESGAVTIVGGGDSAAAVRAANLTEAVTHVSTGGGASLEFIEGKTLPGVAALDDSR